MEFMDGVNLAETVNTYGCVGFVVNVLYVLLCEVLLFSGTILTSHNMVPMKYFGRRLMSLRVIAGMLLIMLGIVGVVCGKLLCDKLFGSVNGYFKPTEKYRVTVEDNVDLDEFYTRYDVLEYKDGIYTVSINEIV